jgi:hypothetical protein
MVDAADLDPAGKGDFSVCRLTNIYPAPAIVVGWRKRWAVTLAEAQV